MKLWILLPIDEDTHWEPWYDKCFGCIVRAETESEARLMASKNAGDEAYGIGIEKTNDPWIDAKYTSCEELADGPAGLVMSDFKSA